MKKKTLFIAICALLIIAALIILLSALRGYTVNNADKASDLSVPVPFALYSGKDIGFSFLPRRLGGRLCLHILRRW